MVCVSSITYRSFLFCVQIKTYVPVSIMHHGSNIKRNLSFCLKWKKEKITERKYRFVQPQKLCVYKDYMRLSKRSTKKIF